MKKFRFSLETARKLRHHQFDVEAAKVSAIQRELTQLDDLGEQLSDWENLEEGEVMRKSVLLPRELHGLEGFRKYLHKQQARHETLRAQTTQRLEAQKERSQEAKRAAELLDKLKDRALERWEKDANKEWDAFAEEVFISQWKRTS